MAADQRERRKRQPREPVEEFPPPPDELARGLRRVEAGAQGAHKLSRGYRPVPTFSAHYLADPGLREAVAEYLRHEREAVTHEMRALEELTPFRKG